MRILTISLIGLCLLAAALFSIQNAASVSVVFLIWHSIQLPLGVLLTLSFVVGLGLSVIIPRVWQMALFQEELDEVSFAEGSRLDTESSEWE